MCLKNMKKEEKIVEDELQAIKEKCKDDKYESVYNFDEEFNTEIKEEMKKELKNNPLLIELFRNHISEQMHKTKLEQMLLDEISNMEDELIEKFSEEDLKIIYKYMRYIETLWGDTVEQAFIYGYCIDKELTKEKAQNT